MVSVEKQNEILSLYNSGTSVNQIERQTGVSVEKANEVLLKFGINPSEEWNRKKREKLVKGLEMYKSGMQFKKICTEIGISPNTLRPYLKEHGGEWVSSRDSFRKNMDLSEVGVLKRSKERKLYPIDETVFDTLNEESSYWIGFIYADGTINCKAGNYKLSIGLAEKDYGHLVKWCNFLKTPIERIKYQPGSKAYYVTLSSYTLNKRLQDLGFDNRKSYSAKPPESLKYNRHFWRGVFDGDGSLYTPTKRKNGVAALVGTMETIKGFIDFTGIKKEVGLKHTGKEMYGVKFHKEAIEVANMMYKNAHIYLDRKYEIYQNWIENQ